jgi:hypothetical protein
MKFLEKSILLCLIVSLFFSCKIQQNVIGKYSIVQRGKYPKIIPATFYVTLNNDSTFNYNYQFEYLTKMVSSGIWKMGEKNSIVLRSYIQDMDNISVTVNESTNNMRDSLLFIFKNPLYKTTKWILKINDMDYLIENDTLLLDNSIVISNLSIIGHEDFTNTFPRPLQKTIQSEKYYVKDTGNNVYNITFPAFVDNNVFHYKPLQDSLKLNKNTLLFRGIKLKKQ